MIVRRLTIIASLLLMLGGGAAATMATAAPAAAASCPKVSVVFARGTAETAPPLGVTGIAFGNSMRNRLPGASVNVHAVNYPASSNFGNRLLFVKNVVDGIKDAQRQITRIAAACPRTSIVLGGYSQGAAVAGYTVSPKFTIPAAYERYRAYAPKPLPTELASHIKAVVLFAPPSERWLRDLGAPSLLPSAAYRAKTVRYCIAGDTVCDGAPIGGPNALHVLYSVNGMTAQGADFAARRL